MKLKLIFRLATEADADGIAALHAKVYGTNKETETPKEELSFKTIRRSKKVFVCTNTNGKILGVIKSVIEKTPEEEEEEPQHRRRILDFCVDEQFRHQGIGRGLLNKVTDTSDREGLPTISNIPLGNAYAIWLHSRSYFKHTKPEEKATSLVMVRPPHPNLD